VIIWQAPAVAQVILEAHSFFEKVGNSILELKAISDSTWWQTVYWTEASGQWQKLHSNTVSLPTIILVGQIIKADVSKLLCRWQPRQRHSGVSYIPHCINFVTLIFIYIAIIALNLVNGHVFIARHCPSFPSFLGFHRLESFHMGLPLLAADQILPLCSHEFPVSMRSRLPWCPQLTRLTSH